MPKRGRPKYGTSNLPIEFYEGKVDHPWRKPDEPFNIDEFWKWQEKQTAERAKKQPAHEVGSESKAKTEVQAPTKPVP
jgi:hypothetical protein